MHQLSNVSFFNNDVTSVTVSKEGIEYFVIFTLGHQDNLSCNFMHLKLGIEPRAIHNIRLENNVSI